MKRRYVKCTFSFTKCYRFILALNGISLTHRDDDSLSEGSEIICFLKGVLFDICLFIHSILQYWFTVNSSKANSTLVPTLTNSNEPSWGQVDTTTPFTKKPTGLVYQPSDI